MTKLRKAARTQEEPPMSVFSAADNIKYRKYLQQVALQGKTPLSKVRWTKAGKPKK